VPLKTFVPP